MIEWQDAQLREWQAAAGDFAAGRLGRANRGPEHHAGGDFPVLLQEMRALGLALLCAPVAQDGLGQDEAALAATLAPLCAVDASAGAAVYATGVAQLALRALATPGNAVPAAVAGEWMAWPAFHDLAEQEWPVLDAAGRLHGRVEMLLPGAHAAWAAFPARKGASARKPRSGKSDSRRPDMTMVKEAKAGNADNLPAATGDTLELVLVPLAAPGLARSAPVRTLGLAACGIVDIELDAVPVAWHGGDLAAAMPQLQERFAVAGLAMLCGLMHGSLETALAYAGERYQGGGPIRDWGEVRRLLAQMQQQRSVARGLLRQQAEGQGGRDGMDGRLALLQVGRQACELATDGVQLLGGNGYMKDYGQEKRMRDAWQLQCLGGSVAWRRQQLAGV